MCQATTDSKPTNVTSSETPFSFKAGCANAGAQEQTRKKHVINFPKRTSDTTSNKLKNKFSLLINKKRISKFKKAINDNKLSSQIGKPIRAKRLNKT